MEMGHLFPCQNATFLTSVLLLFVLERFFLSLSFSLHFDLRRSLSWLRERDLGLSELRFAEC